MSEELRAKAIQQLPETTLALLRELESFSGIQIDFRPYDSALPSARATASPATGVSHEEATIYLPDFENLNVRGVTHELLHIQRYWIEGVPQLQVRDKSPANLQAQGNVENALEHLVIVPREANFGFDATYWNEVSRRTWQQYPWPQYSDELGRRNRALLDRLGLEFIDDPAVIALAKECLVKSRLTAEAEAFASRIRQFMPNDKLRALSATTRFLKIPKRIGYAVYFDVKRRAYRTVELPDH